MLGTLEVTGADGRVAPLGGPKPRALLAALLVAANEAVGTDRLVEALWGASPPESARHSIEVYVSALRKCLGAETIVREPGGYRLSVTPDRLDAHRFESLLHRGEEHLARGRSDRAVEALRGALSLWRGPAYADVAYHDFARLEAERLDELRLTALEARLDAELMLGRQDGIVAELQTLVAAHPLRERFRAQLMLALYRKGRQADALELFRETRESLVDELGLEPAEELRTLERMILAQDPALSPTAHSAIGFVPAQVTTFVGRDRELEELIDLLDDDRTRLVTLVGPGGIGKTRLAVETASAAAYADGVWFVDLASLRQTELVLPILAEALGTHRPPADHIGRKHLLLVLDNFEQLLGAAPPVAELLASCPNLKVIVTSRKRLRLRGEHVFEVSRLDEEASIRLFADRAHSVARSFERNDTTIAVCRRLEGVPLAIELAAARVSDLGQEELRSRLELSTAVVAEGPVDAPVRQSSLRAAVDWSHELLSSEDRRLFARLGVFVGGWTSEAAHEVAGATLDELGALVEKSLVRSESGRFSMLEPIRELAAAKLAGSGEADSISRSHAEWFLALAELAAEEMNGPAQRMWWEQLDAELANARAAVVWFLEQGDCERAGRIVVSLWRFWGGRGHHVEGSRWSVRILRIRTGSPHGRGRASSSLRDCSTISTDWPARNL